jgi:hypothetical protein
MSYAVVWSRNGGADCIGELEVLPEMIRLLGVGADAETEMDLSLSDVDSVYLERSAPPKHRWDPSLVLLTHRGDRIAIGSLEGLGALHELAESVEHGRQRLAV